MISQVDKDKYCMISLIGGLGKAKCMKSGSKVAVTGDGS